MMKVGKRNSITYALKTSAMKLLDYTMKRVMIDLKDTFKKKTRGNCKHVSTQTILSTCK